MESRPINSSLSPIGRLMLIFIVSYSNFLGVYRDFKCSKNQDLQQKFNSEIVNFFTQSNATRLLISDVHKQKIARGKDLKHYISTGAMVGTAARTAEWTASIVDASSSPSMPLPRAMGKGANSKGRGKGMLNMSQVNGVKTTKTPLAKPMESAAGAPEEYDGDLPWGDFSLNSIDFRSENSNLNTNFDNISVPSPPSPVNGTVIKAGAGSNLPTVGNIHTTEGRMGTRRNQTVADGVLVVGEREIGTDIVQVTTFVVRDHQASMKMFEEYMKSFGDERRVKMRSIIKTMLNFGLINNTDDCADVMEVARLVRNIVREVNRLNMMGGVTKRKLMSLQPEGSLMKGMEEEYAVLVEAYDMLVKQHQVEPEKEKKSVALPEKLKSPEPCKRAREEEDLENAFEVMMAERTWDETCDETPHEKSVHHPKKMRAQEETTSGTSSETTSECDAEEAVHVKKRSPPRVFEEVALEDIVSDSEEDTTTSSDETRANKRPGESFTVGPVNKNRGSEFMGCGPEPHCLKTAGKKEIAKASKHYSENGWSYGPGYAKGVQFLTKVKNGEARVQHPTYPNRKVIWSYCNNMTDADLRYKIYFLHALKMHQRKLMPEVEWDTTKEEISSMELEQGAMDYARNNCQAFINNMAAECKVRL
jgi:hypothetical protein